MVNQKYNQMRRGHGLFIGGSGGGALVVKILIHFGGSAPKNVYIGLAFQIALALLSMFCIILL